MKPTPEMIEAAAREMYLCQDGGNPDWPIHVNKDGWRVEPYVGTVPAWKWKYADLAERVLVAAMAVARHDG